MVGIFGHVAFFHFSCTYLAHLPTELTHLVEIILRFPPLHEFGRKAHETTLLLALALHVHLHGHLSSRLDGRLLARLRVDLTLRSLGVEQLKDRVSNMKGNMRK